MQLIVLRLNGFKNPRAPLSSHFDWLLSGPASPMPHSHATSALIIDGSTDGESPKHTDQLSQALNQFWDTEAIGVVDKWVIPYHFTKLLHMTPSELNKIWCVGSPSSLMYPHLICLYGFQVIPY